ncbi:MAG: c-type cytochrome [Hyphomicrobium sp.]
MRKHEKFLVALALTCLSHGASADDDVNKVAFNNHCRTCHSFKKDDNRLGPSMHGMVGAAAGQVAGYRGYSGNISGFRWDEATLDKFIASPTSVASGTTMNYPPVLDAVERAKIIAFLKSISEP